MTLEQLMIFIAVAERQHITQAAEAVHLTPSAVSAAIRALETTHDVQLFDRIGRGIQLTPAGRMFLDEARATVARAESATRMLADLSGLKRGKLTLQASQTVASHWLPRQMMAFHRLYPNIDLSLTIGNSRSVTMAVEEGQAELGFVEDEINSDLVSGTIVATDEMVVVAPPGHPLLSASGDIRPALVATGWIMREEGSGTRNTFEAALLAMGIDKASLTIALTLPSNEAVLSALPDSLCAAALSKAAAAPWIETGRLVLAPVPLPSRHFSALRHRERRLSGLARAFMQVSILK
ncbi:LysR substrate-binding domain-containing protein [Allorhizobium sp. BGMRC 0089]|uniref:LysR substrate-binding domain-containing protein n=1 Tax=Allorhizobium sonneratiae TaxID=2934936 RepID=UPI002034429F|nr:LysR substrate-binding domain-containing protein [Allorhizobium sonneratiae]MCM2293603.1 LysR substrate-binding domain-containing protein [Allorhizobium sonneratiae]